MARRNVPSFPFNDYRPIFCLKHRVETTWVPLATQNRRALDAPTLFSQVQHQTDLDRFDTISFSTPLTTLRVDREFVASRRPSDGPYGLMESLADGDPLGRLGESTAFNELFFADYFHGERFFPLIRSGRRGFLEM